LRPFPFPFPTAVVTVTDPRAPLGTIDPRVALCVTDDRPTKEREVGDGAREE